MSVQLWTGLVIASALAAVQQPADTPRPDARTAVAKFFEAQRLAGEGDKRGALAALDLVAQSGRGFFPGPQSPLLSFRDDPEFAAVVAKLDAAFPRSANGKAAYRFSKERLAPEGIAYDPGRRRLYLSDWAHQAIYWITPGGNPEMLMSLAPLTPNGMSVDAARHILWVAATDAFRGAKDPRSELIRIDLRTGARRSFSAPMSKGFNDVAVAPNGDVYVSDTPGNQIFRLVNGSDHLESFVGPDSGMRSPNGLTVEPSGRYLFVAQGLTPFRVRLADADVQLLKLPPDLDMIGTDGFYFRDGQLYAIQNLVTPGRVLKLSLDEAMEHVTAVEVLDSGHPNFDLPTTGAFVGQQFLVIANSQIYKIAEQRDVTPKLDALVLLGYRLSDGKAAVKPAIRP